MQSLDRFSQVMPWEWQPEHEGPVEIEVNDQDSVLCACGCGQEIDLEDESSFVESVMFEDEFIISEIDHVNQYCKEKRLAVGSQSK